MPSCVLRIAGSTQKVKKFLATSSFAPASIYYKGEPHLIKSRGHYKISGFNLLLSETDGMSKQAHGAVRFIKLHKKEFDRLRRFKFKEAIIDFGLYDLASKNIRGQPIAFQRISFY